MAFGKPKPPKETGPKAKKKDNQPSPLKILLYCFAITAFFLILGLLQVYVF